MLSRTSPVMLLAASMLLLASSAAARPLTRSLLQTSPVAPNTTGVDMYGFKFGSEVGGEPQLACCLAHAMAHATSPCHWLAVGPVLTD